MDSLENSVLNDGSLCDNRSIGVFDSGMGGLTALKELRNVLPHENIIYFGDTARLPYGTRGKDTILHYAKQDINFLLSRDVKAIIVACGTASTVIDKEEMKRYDVPIFTAIDTASYEACRVTKNKKVGVIATSATINSGAQNKSIGKFDKTVKVYTRACPLLVSLVENGYIERDNKVTRLVLEDYLYDMKKNDVDTLIMGCTHFPIIKDAIGDIMGDHVTLINNGEQVAKYAAKKLHAMHLLTDSKAFGECSYYVSDNPENFSNMASIFLSGEPHVSATRIDITKY